MNYFPENPNLLKEAWLSVKGRPASGDDPALPLE